MTRKLGMVRGCEGAAVRRCVRECEGARGAVTRVAGALAVALAMSAAVLAQDKDTLWTSVTAEGTTIALTWDKNHPWDAILATNGAELVAKYFVDARREVTESLGRATPARRDQRTLRFTLPEAVRGTLAGPVCLFIQMPDRRALPIRRPDNRNGDTVGFRYDSWERRIRQAGDTRAAQERVTSAERSLTASARIVAGREATLAQRGWTGLASCDQVAVPTAALGPKPSDVVDLARQPDVARRVCVNRVVNGFLLISEEYVPETLPKLLASYAASKDVDSARSRLSAVYSAAFAGPVGADPPSLIHAIVERLGADNGTVRARAVQTAGFLKDWDTFAPTLKGYTPELGDPDEYLGWTSTAKESAFHLFGPDLARQLKAEWAVQGLPPGSVSDLESYLGSALDAYTGCVDDSVKQLRTKSDNWDALRSAAPQRAASAREFLVRECRQEVNALSTMKTERAALEAQVARDRQTLATVSTPIRLADKPLALNGVSCAQSP